MEDSEVLDVGEVVGHDVDDLMRRSAKGLGVHVAEFGFELMSRGLTWTIGRGHVVVSARLA